MKALQLNYKLYILVNSLPQYPRAPQSLTSSVIIQKCMLQPGTQIPRYVDFNIFLPMGDQANANQLVNGHVVPVVAGAVTVLCTANVTDASTSRRKVCTCLLPPAFVLST